MLGFLASIVYSAIQPVTLGSGLLIGYLFYKDWKQLAWPLLLFIVPGMDGLSPTDHAHGALYHSAVEFIAIAVVTTGIFWLFDFAAHRRRIPKL